MRTKYITLPAVLLMTLLIAAFGDNTNKTADQHAGLQLKIQKINSAIAPGKPAEVKISLANTSDKAIWVENRLQLGYHINLYVLDKNSRPAGLVYPSYTLVLPSKKDFVRLKPGQSISTTMEISKDMLPGFAWQPAYWTFVTKVVIFETGSKFGIQGWTGTLKSYVQLKVE
ncbi:MAG: hypothetical protein ABFD64_01880 [Armatimonadota bacterium]